MCGPAVPRHSSRVPPLDLALVLALMMPLSLARPYICRLDDLRRNYVLNKQNGLVIRPYKKVLCFDSLATAANRCRHATWGRAALCRGSSASPPPAAGPAARCPLQAHLTRTTDRELLYLSAYLAKIAELDSLEGLNHK